MHAISNRKVALKASSERHKEAINNELKSLVVKAEKTVGDTLLTIGVLLAAMTMYKMLKGKGGKYLRGFQAGY